MARPNQDIGARAVLAALASTAIVTATAAEESRPDLYWGDTHLHTSRSFDAYLGGNINIDPDTAYRFARGLPVAHPVAGVRVRLARPLDFLVVADHAELMDVPAALASGDQRLVKTTTGRRLSQMMRQGRSGEAFREILRAANEGRADVMVDLSGPELRRGSWLEVVDAAERNNQPGVFTAFSGWEWSSTPDGANLHRVVFTPSDAESARKFAPFSAVDSNRPEDLWKWLDETSARTGADFIAIPHNSNISKGLMFDDVDSGGRPIDAAYARTRAKWEPVAEITQIKGTSETHPVLSPTDEFAAFEFFPFLLDTRDPKGAPATTLPGDYVRAALGRGLEIDAKTGVNPYKLGVIGSTDSHTGLSTADEDNFQGKIAGDSTLARKRDPFAGLPFLNGWNMSASGLAGVWARENTREAIAEAFRRKEVYATTGPRITLRVYGGYSFRKNDANARDIAKTGYAKGAPMGADLARAPKGRVPSFLIDAVRDPLGANLDRIQIVKGWLGDDGAAHEKVFDAAWSGERKPDAEGRLPAVGDTVDRAAADYSNAIGAPRLTTVWSDPEFDPEVRAFYYVRVLQIPTPRHSLYDSVALQLAPEATGQPAAIQERAYSSPIWYTP